MSGFSAVSTIGTEVTLSWTNPTDDDFAGVTVRRSETDYPVDEGSGTEVYRGTGMSHPDTTVSSGVTYYYSVFSFDEIPNYSAAAQAVSTRVPTIPTPRVS